MGGAVGDALGTPVRSMSSEQIQARYGTKGVTSILPADGRFGAVSAITQTTLFTAEGLLVAKTRGDDNDLSRITTSIYQAYLRWFMTQSELPQAQLLAQHGTCSIVDGILTGFQELHVRRFPDATSLAALKQGRMGTYAKPINNSRGNSAIVRTAPVGLIAGEDLAFDLACAVAQTTHGHPSAYLAAGSLAQIIAAIVHGDSIASAMDKVMCRLKDFGVEADECLASLNQVRVLRKSEPTSLKRMETLGRGQTAVEVLAIALYSCLVAEDDFEKGIFLALNHSGATDCTGAVAGSLLGVRGGAASIPSRFVKPLELRALILEMATDLHDLGQI
ncbi:ADP-ribosylglycohydrolase family protein [Thermodesulfobacteriota bacterium]